MFYFFICFILLLCDPGFLTATTTRTPNNMYILNEIEEERCCLGKEDEIWFWHRIMGHIHFDNFVNINKNKFVREMPEIESQRILCASIVSMEKK
jgi:hypothetical protein